jgi:hypothetical protein
MNDNLTTNASNEAESPAFLVGAVSSSLLNSTLLEANKAIDECVMKTGLTRELVLLYVSGKVDRYKLLMSFCNDC